MGRDFTVLYNERIAWRGFFNFYRDLILHIDTFKEIKTLCEIGISGGGKQAEWCRQFPAATVIGIDIFHPETVTANDPPYMGFPTIELGNAAWQRTYDCYSESIELQKKFNNMNLFHGYDGYAVNTRDMIISKFSKLDILIDDGSVNWEDTMNTWGIWKDAIADNGIFISETPDGNGTSEWIAMTKQQHIDNMNWLAKEHRQIIFDFGPYKIINPDISPWEDDMDFSANYLAIGCHDYKHYMPVIEKYSDCIVAGKENI